MIQRLGFEINDLECVVKGLECRNSPRCARPGCAWFLARVRVQGSGFRVQGSGFMVQDSGLGVCIGSRG